MPTPRRIWFVSSSMSPRWPVTSAAATAPAWPPITSAARERVAGAVDRRVQHDCERRRRRRRSDLDLAGERADRADAVEIGVAREIVAARPGRFGKRKQPAIGDDEVAGLHALQVA